MKQNRQTKEKLLLAAKEEFLEKGYMKASLRSICKKAGVTTGAMYFFFEDKEDLFGALVEGPLKEIYGIMKAHYEAEDDICAGLDYSKPEDVRRILLTLHSGEDHLAMLEATEYLYRFREEFLLLLTKAQGSKYESCIDMFVELSEKHYRRMAEIMDSFFGGKKTDRITLDENTLHCLVHLQMETFIHPLTHGLSLEQAKVQMTAMVKFLTSGWYGLWQ